MIYKLLTILSISLLLLSCGNMSRQQSSLYDELGGESGVAEIVEGFIMEIAADELVLPFFADSNVERFREKITEHFCMLADGPCEYSGDDMVRVHTGMNINEAEFNAVVEHLITAMDDAGTPLGAQNRLLARLASLRSEIIRI